MSDEEFMGGRRRRRNGEGTGTGTEYILQEIGDALLLEDGDFILRES